VSSEKLNIVIPQTGKKREKQGGNFKGKGDKG
jgi:hypothetical protein